MVSLSLVTQIFPTPYGRALTQQICRIFCRTLEKERVLVQRQPIIERATQLADGYVSLLEWQQVFHDYDRLTNPAAYELGAVSIIPPRRLDEVLVFRALDMPAPIDPTRHLPSELQRLLHQVRKHGPTALAVPF